ncbi:DUF6252 family protein [Salegentibacter maritimus]|uniref:Lipoprotein n=1 Tax=Salegentibacter maritimus TaxID=2794347 RepID=A0ABS0TCL1_9FLAO|nr:DUF6252 family protein [Salegentibacter maritimus]MBI6118789.1 hypothetical protein [Salegentibacter maritimus]
MRYIYIPLLLFIFSCSKQDNCDDPVDCLPPLTTTGEGTIGCLINGKPFTPGGGQIGGPIQQAYYNTLEGEYYFGLKGSNDSPNQLIAIFSKGIEIEEGKSYSFGLDQNFGFHANYFLNGGVEQYQTSEIYSGEITFTNFDDLNGIVSGTFWFDAVSEDREVVEIREGRFDMKYN